MSRGRGGEKKSQGPCTMRSKFNKSGHVQGGRGPSKVRSHVFGVGGIPVW